MNNEIKNSNEFQEGQCGGCGTFENVTDNCCEECTKGYPNPTDQETIDALDYYNHHLKLMAKVKDEVQETDAVGTWKKIRTPKDYSLNSIATKEKEFEYNYGQGAMTHLDHLPAPIEDAFPSTHVAIEGHPFINLHDKQPVFNSEGLNKLVSQGGLRRGEVFIIGCPSPLKP